MDAGFIIIVYSIVSYNPDFGLIKTDSLGNIIWSKNYGGLYIAEWPFDGKQTVDGGCVIVGSTRLISAEYSDVWLIKTNSVGDTLWTRIYGGIKGDAGSSIAQTPDEGFILLGGTRSYGAGNSDFWLIRTDTHGDIIWTKTFGGSENDWGYSVQNTSDAGYILVGHTFSFGIGGDVWLIKLEPDSPSVAEYDPIAVEKFQLHQNYPNPFNPSTKISWQSPVGSWQTLKIYDVLGNEVATLVDEYKPAGTYEVEWNAGDFPSGVYFYQLKTENYLETKKMILIK